MNVYSKRKTDRRVISVRRVAKVRSGDKLLSFSVLVAVGDRKGKVGIAMGKGRDTRKAILKAATSAEKKMFKVPMSKTTIPHQTFAKFGAARVLVKPAPRGAGIIAGSSVRAVLEVAGIRDVVAKQIGTSNPINNAYCIMKALRQLKQVKDVVKKVTTKEGQKSDDKSVTKSVSKQVKAKVNKNKALKKPDRKKKVI